MAVENFSYLLSISTGIFSFLVCIIIISRGWKHPQARAFALFTFVFSMWLLSTSYMTLNCQNEVKALFIDRIIYMFVSTIPAVLFHFTTIYSGHKDRKRWIVAGYAIMVMFWILAWSPYFVDGLYHFYNTCHSQARILHHVFLVYFAGYSFAITRDSFILYKEEKIKKKKKQYQFVFLALLAECVVATSAFLPAYNIDSAIFSFAFGFIAIFILFYAMFRHDLFELKIVAIYIFIIFVVIVSVAQFFTTNSTKLRFVNGLVFIVVVWLGFLVVENIKEEIETREKGERLARYLANANARLRDLDKQKTEFVSIASHQLRSPIAAIKGYASMITEGAYGAVPKNLELPLLRILDSGKRIAIMVDDFLNVTRIEQGRMTYDMKCQDVYDVVKSVVGELGVVAKDKNIKLTLTNNSNGRAYVKADKGKLIQIFSNLIDNAIKYTHEGFIKVKIDVLEREKRVLISIKDTGIGIAPEEIQNLFKKFNRASNANKENVLGTGLGLYIAREILKAHEGWVNVESDGVGKGSTFTVELPLCEGCAKDKNEDNDVKK